MKELKELFEENTMCHINTQYKCVLKGFPFVWDKETCKKCQENMGNSQ